MLQRPVSEALLSKKAAVDAVLEKLGLEECQHIKIGNPLNRGISGGQVFISVLEYTPLLSSRQNV